MPRRAERCLQIAPHSLAIVLGGGRPGGGGGAAAAELGRHRIGYEIFADFKRENMQHFWDRRVTAAVAETFFLGWIDEQVLLVQGKEEHLEVLRQGWARRSLKPPSGFQIKCLEYINLCTQEKCSEQLLQRGKCKWCLNKPSSEQGNGKLSLGAHSTQELPQRPSPARARCLLGKCMHHTGVKQK
ncbi:storkhead-box protein 1-like [Cuculus canorus]|uniref:storkhead-box protein 1-like n=1 Tax=Cuculus canorus TaxID=55661 RepID=UPI0023AAF98E|nr:storkhead-box protein 1-like [Cuculus canorus]